LGEQLGCESSAPQQILKALVGAQIIPFRVDRQKSHPYVLLFQSLTSHAIASSVSPSPLYDRAKA